MWSTPKDWLAGNAKLSGMLSCSQAESLVYEYYEEDIQPVFQRKFDRHLWVCRTCRVHYECYSRSVVLSRRVFQESFRHDDFPEEMVETVVNSLEAESR